MFPVIPAPDSGAADGPAARGGNCAPERGATFDHFAIATRRIRDLLPLWLDTLGGRFAVGADNAEVGWRTVRLELGGITCVELIEPLQGSAFFDGFFRSHPAGGLHHVTFLVDDIKTAFERIAAHGYEPFGAGQEWYQLFLHPRKAGGVLLQLMRRQTASLPDDPLAMTLKDVLAGRGYNGTGLPSP
jgi:methylmalonyl-CoA/ethylmalonyl-CoA epimerase